MLTSNSYAIIADVFPPNSRGKAYGITAPGWNVGALLGLIQAYELMFWDSLII